MRIILLPLVILTLLAPRLSAQGLALLRAGDTFEMRLGGMAAEFAQDFNSQYTVGQEGTVNIPLIGEIRAIGLTPPQLQVAIQNKLMAEKIFSRPTVNINLMQSGRWVLIGGGVRNPQRLQWSPDLTLNQAIELAGLGEFGSKKGVRLIREGKVQVYDARKFDKDPSQDPKLLPGDQISVPGQ